MQKSEKSLYDRLGGYNAIAAVVDDSQGRLVSDKQLGRFFIGHLHGFEKENASTHRGYDVRGDRWTLHLYRP